MTDPLRRDPLEFLRVLKKMANNASWQKTMLFGMKGRQVGYKLGLDHYNTMLFSQSMWGRALEIIKLIRNMEEDGVQPNGASYYYICNGMANAEHGYNYDFPTNPMLEKLQHWRVALNALEAAEANGFDTTDTMHNSVIIACTIPTMNHWEVGLKVLHKMLSEDRKMHPQMVEHLKNCLIRNKRPYEVSWLLQKASEEKVEGFEVNNLTSPVYKNLHTEQRAKERERLENLMAAGKAAQEKKMAESRIKNEPQSIGSSTALTESTPPSSSQADDTPTANPNALTPEEERAWAAEQETPHLFSGGIDSTERASHFRPRVYRQEWYKWHAIANKYRPVYAMRKKQLAPRDSPTGIPGFYRL